MFRSDVLKVLAILRGAYPQFYRGIDKKEAEDTVNLWTDIFAEDDPAIVGAAVKSFIESDEKGFPPVPGQIKAKIRLLTQKDELSEIEAWSIVFKAVKNSIYESEEEFDKLPPAVKRLVGSPSQLHDWAMMDSNTLHSVVSSNFQRSYRTTVTREKEIAKLPSDVKRLVKNLYAYPGKQIDALPKSSILEE